MFTTVFAATLAGFAAASPIAFGDAPIGTGKSPQGLETASYVAKFDDVTAGLLADLPVRPITPLGPYDNLYYNLNAISTAGAVAGVKPQSAPNTVVFDALSTTTDGPASISADYDDSSTKFFNFKSFYFGCVVTNAETAASVPTGCDLKVTGYLNGQEIVSQDASFEVDGVQLSANMKKTHLKEGFGKVEKVEFEIEGAVDSSLLASLMDNFEYTVTLDDGKSY